MLTRFVSDANLFHTIIQKSIFHPFCCAANQHILFTSVVQIMMNVIEYSGVSFTSWREVGKVVYFELVSVTG